MVPATGVNAVSEPGTQLILASASPRRVQLLRALGLSFEVIAANVDETPRAGERPEALVRRLAAQKAVKVARTHVAATVMGADTVVAVGMEIFGKPGTAEQARQILTKLSGRTHQVVTGVAVWNEQQGRGFTTVAMAQVTFRALSALDIDGYIATGEPMDKAGAYAIQGQAGKWVQSFAGNLETVIGLPLDVVKRLLHRMGLV